MPLQRERPILNALDAQIDAMEAAYEFLLAYAAQGREDDNAGALTSRETAANIAADSSAGAAKNAADQLTQLDQALAAIAELLDSNVAFCQVVGDDISKTRKALALIRSAPRISSELIDNLNASAHLKAVLTDLFLISEFNRIAADP